MNFNRHLKVLDGFPGYKVEPDGRVLNKDGKELKPYLDGGGYLTVRLCNHGVEKNCRVHRLVAEEYIPNPENKRTVNHIDGNKFNNDVSNLEWNTDSENLKHAYAHGLKRSYLTDADRKLGSAITKERTSKKVLVEDTGNIYQSLHDCASDLGCDLGAISKCCNGKLKQHHGYRFRYVD